MAFILFPRANHPGFLLRFTRFSLQKLKKTLMASFNYSFAQGILSDTQNEGITTLLLKQDPQGR